MQSLKWLSGLGIGKSKTKHDYGFLKLSHFFLTECQVFMTISAEFYIL